MSNSRTIVPTRSPSSTIYPFSAIVGQEEMKLALVLNVIDPLLGGVLIMGHRGTGKSTAVRGLAELLPQISVVAGCAYRCDPAGEQNLCAECQGKLVAGFKLPREKVQVAVVDLPLGATEDRVCGSIDLEAALKDGAKSFEPGLLARANRAFLYIDEVNLLEDHLVDLLLDVAVTGRHRVERESISVEHPARFVLIGSGNPEEGELRPQLLDRFGLHVAVTTENDLEQRVEIVERRELFESARDLFLTRFEKDQEQLRRRITKAQNSFLTVKVDRALLRKIAQLSTELKLDGHRGELTITRASRALAAFENRKKVTEADVKQVAPMSLRHRLRREPFDETASSERIRQALANVFDKTQNKGSGGNDGGNTGGVTSASRTNSETSNKETSKSRSASLSGTSGEGSSGEFQIPPIPNSRLSKSELEIRIEKRFRLRGSSSLARNQTRRSASKLRLNSLRGRYTKADTVKGEGFRVAIDATLRAAAAEGVRFQAPGVRATVLVKPDTRHPASIRSDFLRYKHFSRKQGSLYIFAIDTSGSMAPKRINRAREVALSLLRQSYIRRDSVAIVVFRGTSADEVLPPSRSMLRAKRALDCLTVGGGTPLSAGILCSMELAKRAQAKHGEAVVLLFTDGHANVSLRSASSNAAHETANRKLRQERVAAELSDLGCELRKAKLTAIVVDTQNGFTSDTNAREVADKLGAQFVRIR